MNAGNESAPNVFILLGFSDYPWLERPLFMIVLVAYIVTLVGNIFIIVVSKVDPQLDSPMYFFLSNLSFLDLCFTTTTIPQLLLNLWGPNKSISYGGCVTQFYMFHFLGATECIFLAIMSLDRYIAICKPLRYSAIMHQRLCILLVGIAWLSGLAHSLLQASLTVQLPLCGNNKVENFLCEVPVIIKMSCADTTFNVAVLSIGGTLYSLVPLSLILISYGFIVATILKIQSSEGKRKAFNTCGSHIIVVSLFYGPVISMYVQPSTDTQNKNKLMSMFYSLMTPMLNPFIYTLRNKDMKGAMKRLLVSLYYSRREQT